MAKINKRHRTVWAGNLGAVLNATQSGYFGVCELMRLHHRGLTAKEQVYVQERLDRIREAIDELRVISTRTRKTSNWNS